jgi:hypothetical protein
MGRKALGASALLLGFWLVALSVLADAIGIGPGGFGFGWEQKLGVAVGTTMVWFAALDLAGWSPRPGPRRSALGASGTRSAATSV